MPLRANQVYRHGDRSQVDFIHQSDPGQLENLHYSSFGEIKFFLHISLPVFRGFFFLQFKVFLTHHFPLVAEAESTDVLRLS